MCSFIIAPSFKAYLLNVSKKEREKGTFDSNTSSTKVNYTLWDEVWRFKQWLVNSFSTQYCSWTLDILLSKLEPSCAIASKRIFRLQLEDSYFCMKTYTLTRLIFPGTYFRGCQNQNISRGYIFVEGRFSVISRGLIFAVNKVCI